MDVRGLTSLHIGDQHLAALVIAAGGKAVRFGGPAIPAFWTYCLESMPIAEGEIVISIDIPTGWVELIDGLGAFAVCLGDVLFVVNGCVVGGLETLDRAMGQHDAGEIWIELAPVKSLDPGTRTDALVLAS